MNVPTNDEYQFLCCIRDHKDLPFRGAAGAAVISFLEEFGWITLQGTITEHGHRMIALYEEGSH